MILGNPDVINKFVKTYNLPNCNQMEAENINRLITANEIKAVIKKFLANKSPGPDGFTDKLYQSFKEGLIPILLKLFKNSRGGNIFKPFYEVSIILIPKPDKDTRDKENYRSLSLISIDSKILNKILENWIQKYIKKIIHHDQVRFILGMQSLYNIFKSKNVIYHENKMNDKYHVIIAIDAEKSF